ncbi:hypothetical protein Fcan01_04027 [Folsomia candida]|uniref:Uncharacterized protein n=1 Tax=Folsomia candida TaxID=158441 RepID=A0A226EN75_FOLCA|nr:hypothetical protein Fcan01_04027 [Folsomia candida]
MIKAKKSTIIVLILQFACCTCVDKVIRRSWIHYRCKPRTPRRVRFDCENPHNGGHGSHQRLTRSGTSPQLSGLMAHSTYLQRNSNYRFHNSVVHTDRFAAPIQVRTMLERESVPAMMERDPASLPPSHPQHTFVYHSNRRSSTPTPTGPPNSYYSSVKPKSPIPLETTAANSVTNHLDVRQRRYSTPNSPTMYAYPPTSPKRDDSNYSSISYLPEVRAYLQFMELDSSARQRSYSFSGRNTSRSSSRRSSRRSTRHRPRSRSPSPYALERTAMVSADEMSNYSSPSSYGQQYLTPQGSSDQGSFKSPESGTPDWLEGDDLEHPPSYEDCLTSLSRSSSIKTSFI